MPCRDYMDDHPEIFFAKKSEDLVERVKFAEANLCAVLEKIMSTTPLHQLPSIMRGIQTNSGYTTEQLMSWHAEHKIADKKAHNSDIEAKMKALMSEYENLKGQLK